MKGLNGLVGKDVRYSFSKIIHELISDTKYELYNLDNVQDILTLSFTALNITNPYKQEIIKYLDEIDVEAKKIGSVNTIIKKDNKLYGYNTDLYGFKKTIEKYNIMLKNKSILILGNGATAKMIKYYLQLNKVSEIHFLVRNKKDVNEYVLEELTDFSKYHILINTTPVGNIINDAIPFNLDLCQFTNLEVVIDLNYNPLYSNLLLAAKKQKIQFINGLYMLVAQALKANYLLTNNENILKRIDEIYNKVLQKQINLVLIGMPNSGKSTIGKRLAKIYQKKYLDTDKLFFGTYKVTPEEFLRNNSEELFRQYESKIIEHLKYYNNSIISTGGGVILKGENILDLQKNGLFIFINRPLEELKKCDFTHRPLVSNLEKLEKLYYERINKYLGIADVVVENNDDIEKTIERIQVKLHEVFGN